MKHLKNNSVYLVLVSTFLFWSGVYVVGKMVSSDLPAALVAGLRCLIAVFPLMFMAKKYRNITVERSDWKYFIAIGGFGYFATILLIQIGISLTGASMSALINSLTPVGVTVCAAIILKEKVTPVKILCLVLAIGGTSIISSGARESQLLGILLCLLSVISWSLASVFMRKMTAKYPPIKVTAYGIATSLVFHLPVSIVSVVQSDNITWNAHSILCLLYLGLVGSGLSQFTWTYSLSRLPASTCSLFYPLQPIFAAILGALLLGETFSPTFFVGMVLICGDVVLNVLENRRLSLMEEQ